MSCKAGFRVQSKGGQRQPIPDLEKALGIGWSGNLSMDKPFYLSQFAFEQSHLEAWQRKHSGSLAGMAGNVTCRPLWLCWDLDHGDVESVEQARKLVAFLEAKYGPASIAINLSGGRGVHVRLRLPEVEPGHDVPATTKNLATAIAREAKVDVDESIYDISRIVRMPNSQHEKSGRYAVPVCRGELKLNSPEEIWETASKQRPSTLCWVPPTDKELQTLLNDWEEARRLTARKPLRVSGVWQHRLMPARLNRRIEDIIANGLGTDGRKLALFQAAANMGEIGGPGDTVRRLTHAVLLPIGRRAGLPDDLIQRQVEDGFRRGTAAAGLDTSADWSYPFGDDEPAKVVKAEFEPVDHLKTTTPTA